MNECVISQGSVKSDAEPHRYLADLRPLPSARDQAPGPPLGGRVRRHRPVTPV